MGDFRDDQHHTFLVKSNLRSVAVENVIEFAAEKQGLQSSIRLGIFVAQSTRRWESNDSLSGQLLNLEIPDLAQTGDLHGAGRMIEWSKSIASTVYPDAKNVEN